MKTSAKALMVLLALVAVSYSLSAQAEEKVIAIYEANNQLDSGKRTDKIIPIGTYANGKYTPVDEWLEDTAKLEGQRYGLLTKHAHYVVLHNGKPVAFSGVKEIVNEDYGCNAVVSGHTGPDVSEKAIRQKIKENACAYAETGKNDSLKYYNVNFLALSLGNKPVALSEIESREVKLDKAVLKNIRLELRKSVGAETNMPTIDTALKINSITATDIDNDGIPENILTAEYYDGKAFYSLVYAFHLWGTRISPFYVRADQLEEGSWGGGYDYLDSADIDDDGVMEVLFGFYGYESYGYELYLYHENTLEKVVDFEVWGC